MHPSNEPCTCACALTQPSLTAVTRVRHHTTPSHTFQGEVVMSSELEVMYNCFVFQTVPPAWTAAGYPCLKVTPPLGPIPIYKPPAGYPCLKVIDPPALPQIHIPIPTIPSTIYGSRCLPYCCLVILLSYYQLSDSRCRAGRRISSRASTSWRGGLWTGPAPPTGCQVGTTLTPTLSTQPPPIHTYAYSQNTHLTDLPPPHTHSHILSTHTLSRQPTPHPYPLTHPSPPRSCSPLRLFLSPGLHDVREADVLARLQDRRRHPAHRLRDDLLGERGHYR